MSAADYLKRARISSIFIDPPGVLLPFIEALEAVLEMHHRRVWSVLSGDHMSFAQTEFPDQCDHCRRAYPCPTISAIKSALAGGETDG